MGRPRSRQQMQLDYERTAREYCASLPLEHFMEETDQARQECEQARARAKELRAELERLRLQLRQSGQAAG